LIGEGCCVSDKTLRTTTANTLGACQSQCLAAPILGDDRCSFVSYGWARGASTLCITWARNEECSPLQQGPYDCGGGSGDDGVKTYQLFRSQDKDVPSSPKQLGGLQQQQQPPQPQGSGFCLEIVDTFDLYKYLMVKNPRSIYNKPRPGPVCVDPSIVANLQWSRLNPPDQEEKQAAEDPLMSWVLGSTAIETWINRLAWVGDSSVSRRARNNDILRTAGLQLEAGEYTVSVVFHHAYLLPVFSESLVTSLRTKQPVAIEATWPNFWNYFKFLMREEGFMVDKTIDRLSADAGAFSARAGQPITATTFFKETNFIPGCCGDTCSSTPCRKQNCCTGRSAWESHREIADEMVEQTKSISVLFCFWLRIYKLERGKEERGRRFDLQELFAWLIRPDFINLQMNSFTGDGQTLMCTNPNPARAPDTCVFEKGFPIFMMRHRPIPSLTDGGKAGTGHLVTLGQVKIGRRPAQRTPTPVTPTLATPATPATSDDLPSTSTSSQSEVSLQLQVEDAAPFLYVF